jgi:hypothetical protein
MEWMKRTTKAEIKKFKEEFKSRDTGCIFRVTLFGAHGELVPTAAHCKSGPWKTMNDEFEASLADMELPNSLKSLPGNMLLCWDGNHMLFAWMEVLAEENASMERLREQMVDCRIYKGE